MRVGQLCYMYANLHAACMLIFLMMPVIASVKKGLLNPGSKGTPIFLALED